MQMTASSNDNEKTDAVIKSGPVVSIIILNLDETGLTLKCVESVRKHTRSDVCEIIVVDNGSAPERARSLRNSLSKDVQFISLKENMFFGEGNNIAAEKAAGRFLLFLNNDVTIAGDVVGQLLAAFQNCFAAGAIGPRFLYPDGRLQEAGGFIRCDGWPVQQGKGELVLDPHFEQGCHIVDYCSAACLLVEKSTFFKLGGFDPLFDPAYFEDCDLCLRIRSLGLFTYLSSETFVYHEENTTSATLWHNEQINDIASRNRQTFLSRWGFYLETRLRQDLTFPKPSPRLPEYMEKAHDNRSKAVVLCSSSLIGADESCSLMLECANALQKVYRITFAAPQAYSRLRVASLCRHFQVELNDFDIISLSALDEYQYDHILRFGFDRSSGYASVLETLKAILRTPEVLPLS